MGLFHAMQSGAVRKMQRELRKQKRLLTAVVKLMLYTATRSPPAPPPPPPGLRVRPPRCPVVGREAEVCTFLRE